MLFTIIKTEKDNTTSSIITADTLKQAYDSVKPAHGQQQNATVRIYPTTTNADGSYNSEGLQAGALMVVKRTTANMISREGGNIQHRLYNACRTSPVVDNDVLDCIQVAIVELIESISKGLDIEQQYKNAYKALNKHLYDSATIRLDRTAQRTIYIEDIEGDIISTNDEIAKILEPGSPYTGDIHLFGFADDMATVVQHRRIINTVALQLKSKQKIVLKHMAKGNSVRQIAEKMNRAVSTTQEHITKIREKAKELYPNGYNKK